MEDKDTSSGHPRYVLVVFDNSALVAFGVVCFQHPATLQCRQNPIRLCCKVAM